jgi:hypothetical protein
VNFLRRRFSFLFIVLSAAVLMTGCLAASGVGLLDTAARGIFQRQDVNLNEKSYAAADYLIVQAQDFVGRGALIKADVLKEIHQPETSSDIGKVIPEQVGTRLSQLGYNIDLSDVKTAEVGTALGMPPQGRKPNFILGGSYKRSRKTLDIGLRITDAGSGRIVGAFDYSMPLNNEIAELSEPKARIYRVTP